MCNIRDDIMLVPDFYKGHTEMEVMEIGMHAFPKGSIIPYEDAIKEGKKIVGMQELKPKPNKDNFNYYGDDLCNHIFD